MTGATLYTPRTKRVLLLASKEAKEVSSSARLLATRADYFRRMMRQAAIVMPMRLSTTRMAKTTSILMAASMVRVTHCHDHRPPIWNFNNSIP